MANPTQVTQNIKRTVQEYLDGAGLGVPLLYDDTQKPLPTDAAWIDVRWMKILDTELGNGEKQSRWNLFLDCWSWLGSDPTATIRDDLVDKVRDKCRDRCIPLLDYAEVDDPAATGYFVRLRIDGDDLIEPDDRKQGRSLTIAVTWLQRN